MFLVVYDISKTGLRTRFAKFLEQYGVRVQFSVFRIANSSRVLENLRIDINAKFKKKFGQADSVLIYHVPDSACVAKFGYPVDDDTDLVVR